MTALAGSGRKWIICDCCGQTWRLPRSLAMEHHGSCRPEDRREVMPTFEHEALRRAARRVIDHDDGSNRVNGGLGMALDTLRAVLTSADSESREETP